MNLSLALDSTTFHTGQAVSIALDIKNTLPGTNHVQASNNWASDKLDMVSRPYYPSPYKIAVFQGNYTESGIAAASPLILWNPVVETTYSALEIQSYDFQPTSDIAAVNTGETPNPWFTSAITYGLSQSYYWAGAGSNLTQRNFTPGVYTVVGGDEWGALVVLHFTVTDAAGTNSVSSSSVNGLRLSLSLDFKTYFPGQNVSIIIDETNTLTAVNNIPVSDSWPYGHLQKAPCDYTSPFGITAFQGDYSSSNFSTGTPLTLYDPHAAWLCTTINPITSYSFQPSTDWAKIVENPANPITGPQQMRYQLTLPGYWPDNDYNSDSKLTGFALGVYTIVAGDEWGNLVVLHFTVTN